MLPNPTHPKQLGFHMPAEWESHEATWLSWPHNIETWPGTLTEAQQIWAKMTRELSLGEKVHINVNDTLMLQSAKRSLQEADVNLDQIIFHLFPTDDAWIRDHGPTFVVNKSTEELALIDWDYNAWGGKYPPYDRDNAIPQQIAEYLQIKRFVPDVIFEGGSIEVNGQGTLMTTQSCLLNPNRNPHLSQKQIEEMLHRYLNVTHFLWLGDGIVGDDTDGHIDDIARFVDTNKILCVIEEDAQDENFAPLQHNYKLLQKLRDPNGKYFEIITIPMPKPVYFSNQRLPASYANFYIGNKVVLVPTFEDAQDEKALEIVKMCFPNRHVVGIDSRKLVIGLGAFHCVTQQIPSI